MQKLTYKFLLIFCLIISANGWASSSHHNKSAYHNFSPGKKIVFSPRKLRWYAVDSSGRVVRSGKASGGSNYCPDIHRSCHTPVGTFYVIGKGGAGCRSSRYPVGRGGARMPYCMYFSKFYALHGSYEVRNYNASHGCIRILPSDARWLSNNFVNIGTKIVVLPY